MKILLIALIICFNASADIFERIHEDKWNDIDIVWIEDKDFPLYQISFYFADGALSDHPLRVGESKVMFEQLTTGTNSYTKDQILSSLEFYGTQINTEVTHEYSTFSFNGLIKDIVPTTKMICHLFKNSVFPKSEVNAYIKKEKSKLKNILTDHSELADRAFRNLSLKMTAIGFPADGKLSTLDNIGPVSLQKKLTYYSNKVRKKIFIKAPTKDISLKTVIEQDCGWKNTAESYARSDDYGMKPKKNPNIYFVEVPNASQSQVRVGSYLPRAEYFNKDELMTLSSYLLGGGFTSLLMEELRTKKGLVYSLSATSVNQNTYGRSMIRTATSNENLVELLDIIKKNITAASAPEFLENHLTKTKDYLKGSFLLSLDSKEELLRKIIHELHKGRKISDLKNFASKISLYSNKDVAQMIGETFAWDEQTITIVGPKSTYNKIKKEIKEMKLIDYKKFL